MRVHPIMPYMEPLKEYSKAGVEARYQGAPIARAVQNYLKADIQLIIGAAKDQGWTENLSEAMDALTAYLLQSEQYIPQKCPVVEGR